MAHGRFDNPIIAALAGVKDFFRKQDLTHQLKENESIEGKTCLVTGANSGLGYGIAVELAKRGGKVIMGCRSQIPEAGEKVKQESGSELVEMKFLDLSKIDSIHEFVDQLKREEISLDVVILNAGVALPESRETDSGLEEMFLVNYLANFILVSKLLKQEVIPNTIYSGSTPNPDFRTRIIFISSDSHRGSSMVDHDQFGKFENYGVTKGMNYYSYYKLVLNTYATELSRRLNPNGVDVPVHVICPGPVNSNIAREAPWLLRKILKFIFYLFFKSPQEAAKPVVFMAISSEYGSNTNRYLHMFNPKEMDEKCYIPQEGQKLWDHSLEVWKRVDVRAVDV